MSTGATETGNILEYKGHPLRRKDNLIYYGSMAEKYIIMMQVTESKKIKDLDVATKVAVQLQLTDPNLKSRDRVVKKSEKNSLYAAIDVASVWLDRALNTK
jgi:ribosome-associated translation inhibitor RaiA